MQFDFFFFSGVDNKPTKILKDVEESANLIDDDFYPSFRPSIDCDVLNSVIVEENDEDMQSLSSSITTSPSRNAGLIIEDFSSNQGGPNKDISVGGQDSQQISSNKEAEDKELEITKTEQKLIIQPTNTNETRQKFSISSRCVIDENVGKETDVDDEDDEEDIDFENGHDRHDSDATPTKELYLKNGRDRNDSDATPTKDLYHSTLVTTCVDEDSDEEEVFEGANYDLKVPNESWTDFKSSHDRPPPVGCSSDSPSGASSEASGPDKDHYDSLEDDPETEPPIVPVQQKNSSNAGGQKIVQSSGGGQYRVSTPQSRPESTASSSVIHGKRSLPSLPHDHSLQQIRAYEILRQQWQKHYDDSLEDVRPRCVEGRDTEQFKVEPMNKRQLPKPPAVSPLVFNNDSGIASLEDNKCYPENSHFSSNGPGTNGQCDEKVAGNSTMPVEPPQNNFLWVGFNEDSSVNRRPKNHDRLTSSSSNKKRHSAPPGSLDQFTFNQNPKKNSASSGHVTSKKSSDRKTGTYDLILILFR